MSKKDYRFFKEGEEKDPIIGMMQTAAQATGNLGPEHIQRLSDLSGLAPTTIKGWFFGDTKRPMAITARFFLEAVDCRLTVVRSDGTEIRGPRGK
jgi:hypothetical protein